MSSSASSLRLSILVGASAIGPSLRSVVREFQVTYTRFDIIVWLIDFFRSSGSCRGSRGAPSSAKISFGPESGIPRNIAVRGAVDDTEKKTIMRQLATSLLNPYKNITRGLFTAAKMPLRDVKRLELPATADLHVHLRQGAMMELITPQIRRGGVDTVFVMVCSPYLQ